MRGLRKGRNWMRGLRKGRNWIRKLRKGAELDKGFELPPSSCRDAPKVRPNRWLWSNKMRFRPS
jgi:hypothetical protein